MGGDIWGASFEWGNLKIPFRLNLDFFFVFTEKKVIKEIHFSIYFFLIFNCFR